MHKTERERLDSTALDHRVRHVEKRVQVEQKSRLREAKGYVAQALIFGHIDG
jgi:hypothetical protein